MKDDETTAEIIFSCSKSCHVTGIFPYPFPRSIREMVNFILAGDAYLQCNLKGCPQYVEL